MVVADSDVSNITTPPLHINANKSWTTHHCSRGAAAYSVTDNIGRVEVEEGGSDGLYEINLRLGGVQILTRISAACCTLCCKPEEQDDPNDRERNRLEVREPRLDVDRKSVKSRFRVT